MRKLSENERRIVRRLSFESNYVCAVRLPQGRRSDARARAIMALIDLELIEDEHGQLQQGQGRRNINEAANKYADYANLRLTEKGRKYAEESPAIQTG